MRVSCRVAVSLLWVYVWFNDLYILFCRPTLWVCIKLVQRFLLLSVNYAPACVSNIQSTVEIG